MRSDSVINRIRCSTPSRPNGVHCVEDARDAVVVEYTQAAAGYQ